MCDSGHNAKLQACTWKCQNICRNLWKQHPTQSVHIHTKTHILLAEVSGLTFILDLIFTIKLMHIESITETRLVMSPPQHHFEGHRMNALLCHSWSPSHIYKWSSKNCLKINSPRGMFTGRWSRGKGGVFETQKEAEERVKG